MKKIDISTKKHPNTYLLIDDIDFEWVSLFKWTPEQKRDTIYVVRSLTNTNGGKRLVRIHRDIVRARSFEHVDHKNGNGLDNRRCNLRICNHTANQQNRIKRIKKNGNIYKGVFQRKPGKYIAYITVNRKRFYLGTFDCPINAAKEYDSKALHYFGRFARLNFDVKYTRPTSINGK